MALPDMVFFELAMKFKHRFFSGYRSGYCFNLYGEYMNKNKYLVSVFLFNV